MTNIKRSSRHRGMRMGWAMLCAAAGILCAPIQALEVWWDTQTVALLQALIRPAYAVHKTLSVVHFLPVNDSTFNAFTAGEPIIFVHTGCLEQCPTVDALAGVLLHEVGHVAGQHVWQLHQDRKRLGAHMLPALLGIALMGASKDAAHSVGVGLMMSQMLGISRKMAFSREKEEWADHFALRALTQARWPMQGFLHVMHHHAFNKHDETTQSGYWRSHPFSRDRAAKIQRRQNAASYGHKPLSMPRHLVRAFALIQIKWAASTTPLAYVDAKIKGLAQRWGRQAVCSFPGKYWDDAAISSHNGAPRTAVGAGSISSLTNIFLRPSHVSGSYNPRRPFIVSKDTGHDFQLAALNDSTQHSSFFVYPSWCQHDPSYAFAATKTHTIPLGSGAVRPLDYFVADASRVDAGQSHRLPVFYRGNDKLNKGTMPVGNSGHVAASAGDTGQTSGNGEHTLWAYGRAIVAYRRGQKDHALHYLGIFEHANGGPDAFTWELRAQILANHGAVDLALHAMDRALSLQPQNPFFAFFKARLLWQMAHTCQGTQKKICSQQALALLHPLTHHLLLRALAWQMLAKMYGIMQAPGRVKACLAEEASAKQQWPLAAHYAEEALKRLPASDRSWVQQMKSIQEQVHHDR